MLPACDGPGAYAQANAFRILGIPLQNYDTTYFKKCQYHNGDRYLSLILYAQSTVLLIINALFLQISFHFTAHNIEPVRSKAPNIFRFFHREGPRACRFELSFRKINAVFFVKLIYGLPELFR